jgi:hypothetical protein
MPSLVINCAGDSELAKKINDYLVSKISESSNRAMDVNHTRRI